MEVEQKPGYENRRDAVSMSARDGYWILSRTARALGAHGSESLVTYDAFNNELCRNEV